MLRQRQPLKTSGSKIVPHPAAASKKGLQRYSRSWPVRIAFLLIGFIYIVIPVLFYFSPLLRRHAVFLNYVSLQHTGNLSAPVEAGLVCASNFYVSSSDNIKLGAWHIPAKSSLVRCGSTGIKPGSEFSDNRPVFLYLHGNAGTRAGGHRVKLYKVLSSGKTDAHIVTFDYRGYGDSTNEPPSVVGLIQDAHAVFNWLKAHVDRSRIYIWGHSLGTGVAVGLLEVLAKNNDNPAALILEAPFNKLTEAARYHPISLFHRYMPFFDFFFTNPIASEETYFNSEDKIGKVTAPILILHARDDSFVPFNLGKKLHERALADRPNNVSPAEFVEFDASHKYGHKSIYKHSSLPDIILEFMQKHSVRNKVH